MNFSKKASKIVFTTIMIILSIFLASATYAELRLDSVSPQAKAVVSKVATLSGAAKTDRSDHYPRDFLLN